MHWTRGFFGIIIDPTVWRARMDVAAWLRDLGLGQYVGRFRENEIEADVLPELTEADLEKLGLPLGPRKRILKAIASLGEAPKTSGTESLALSPKDAAERRQLTVMFCDLVGSTALSARLDPEDMRHVIRGYQDACSGVVARYDGFLAKFMGDGILAYFGFPRAHEDDAERAVRAGLEIAGVVRTLKTRAIEKLQVRVGIATGLVVVGDLVGQGAAQEQAVVGDTPNLAARLQGVALPGQVVIAEATRRLLGDVFDIAHLGGQSLKGIAGQPSAYGVISERIAESRFEARASGAMSNMVGRDHELALMLERWKQAKAGEGQLVLLSGEAGIGKSRLARGMIDAVSSETHVRVSYQCSPYHADSPLYPMIQQLAFAAGIKPDDDNDDKLDRLEKVLVGAESDRPLFAALLGLQTEGRYGALSWTPQQQRARTLQALVNQLVELSRGKPVLFVLEDAHWIDATTLELIDLCLDRVASARVLMLVTTRPTFQHGFGGHPIVTKLALNRLGRDQIASIVNRLTNGKMLPGELLGIIAAKTDGVPLFVEEITKTVLESGELRETTAAYQLTGPLSRLSIPSTLYDSLMARLDRLQPVKEVAQTAACIGRDFDYRLLKAVSPLDDAALQDALERLTSAELIFRRGAPPDSTYIFKHALVRDAAYENLLKTRRQTIHAKLVEVLEVIGAAAPELLAHHATAAGMTEPAVRYWLKAGEQAAARFANKEAVSHLKTGIGLLGSTLEVAEKPRLDLDLHSALASVLMVTQGYGSDEVGRISTRSIELCRQVGDEATLATVLWQAWLFNWTRADHVAATAFAQELEDRMSDTVDPAARLAADVALGLSLFAVGKPLEARAKLDQAVRTYSRLKGGPVAYRYGMEVGAVAHGYRAWCLGMLGYPEQAIEGKAVLLEVLERIKHPFTLARGLNYCSMISVVQRDWRGALQFADRAIQVAREYDLQMVSAIGLAMRGLARATVEPSATSSAEIRDALDDYRRTGARFHVPFLLSLFAEASLVRKDWDDGMSAISEALSLIEETGERHVLPEVYRIRGDLLIHSKKGDPEADYLKALELARLQGTRLFELRAAKSLAQLWAAQQKRAEARDLLIPIYEWFTEGFNTSDLKSAKEQMERLA
jgi:class 3 adenylate cyclase/tetratricopeptide (TPR) repeat protein